VKGEVLYESLARGHATKLIQECPDLAVITGWLGSQRRAAAVSAFRVSANSKKPGRVVERISKHLRPAFGRVHLAQWDKEMKAVIAVRLASASETDVFAMTIDEQKAFTERSIILSDLLFFARGQECSTNINIAANISHHTVSRLLERGASTPETIKADVLKILQDVRALRAFLSLGIEHSLSKLQGDITYDFILPYGDGGLIVRTLRINTSVKSFFSDPMPVFSVRTYLDGSMLSTRDRERMAGFRLSRDPIVSAEDSRHILAWIQGNAEETDPRRRLLVSQDPDYGTAP